MKHTPTPWHNGALTTNGSPVCIYSASSSEPREQIAACYRWVGHQEAQANAEFIVRACNSFDDMLAALKMAKSVNEQNFGAVPFYITDAIAKAEAK